MIAALRGRAMDEEEMRMRVAILEEQVEANRVALEAHEQRGHVQGDQKGGQPS